MNVLKAIYERDEDERNRKKEEEKNTRKEGKKRVKFYMRTNLAIDEGIEEIVEFEDSTTKKEIEEHFTEWVFERLDSAIIYLDEEEEED